MARVGIIGSGWWATSRMMPDLQSIPGCELVALVEPEPGRRAEVAERLAPLTPTHNHRPASPVNPIPR